MIGPFSGVRIIVVAAGTEVGKDRDGNPVIVTDESAVFNGPQAWVTQTVYDKLKGADHE